MASLARTLSAGAAVACSTAMVLTFAPGAVAGSAAAAAGVGVPGDVCSAPAGVTCTYDVPYGTGSSQTLDVYIPTRVTGEASVILIHGGGWVAGSSRDYYPEAVYYAENGFAVFSINYTLATTGNPSWPQAFEDVEAAAGWVTAHAADYGADGTRLGAVGASAGAHLAALLDTAGPEDGVRLLTAVSLSGPMDLDLTYRDGDDYVQWAIQQLLGCVPGDCNGTDVAASPISHVTSDDGPLLFFNSSNEIVPLSGARAMKRVLVAAGVRHRLVIFSHSDAHATEYECFAFRVFGMRLKVIDGTLRWLGKFLNGKPLIPTGTACGKP